MSKRKSSKTKIHHAGLVLPDLRLTKSQIHTLKRKFKNDLIRTLGGKDALTQREISLCEVTVVTKQIVAVPGSGSS